MIQIRTCLILCTFNVMQIGLMRGGQLLAESAPEKLLERFQCSFLEDAFLKLCEAQNNSIVLTESAQESKAEDTDSAVLNQDQDIYGQTKVYIKIIYAVLIII